MPESFIPVWMSIGEAEQLRATLGELEDSEAGLPERELSLIDGALEEEKPRSFEQMQAEQRLSEGTGEALRERVRAAVAHWSDQPQCDKLASHEVEEVADAVVAVLEGARS